MLNGVHSHFRGGSLGCFLNVLHPTEICFWNLTNTHLYQWRRESNTNTCQYNAIHYLLSSFNWFTLYTWCQVSHLHLPRIKVRAEKSLKLTSLPLKVFVHLSWWVLFRHNWVNLLIKEPSLKDYNYKPSLSSVCHCFFFNLHSAPVLQVLLSLLTVKMPITDADQIRALACKALVGLSRSSSVRQIISKLPLFSSGHIQQLMKEPLLQDKRSEHVKFCKFAAELIERISGKPLMIGTDVSLAWLQRASVVAQSRITFPEKELLLLIRNHLVAKGLHDTATILTKEAELPSVCLSLTSLSTSAFPSVAPPPPATPVATLPRTPRLANGVGSRLANHPSLSSTPGCSHPQTRPSTSQSTGSSSTAFPSTSVPLCSNGSPLIGRIVFSRERQAGSPVVSCKKPRVLRQKSDHGAFSQSPAMKKQFDRLLPSPPALDGIITEYLREQHARCKNPVATCPPFSLFTPHQCPEPKQRRQAPINFTSRHTRRVIYPKYGGVDGGCFDRHLIFSR